MDGGRQPQGRGVLAVIVVELDAAVQRQGVADLQVDIDGAGRDPGAHHGRDPAVGEAIDVDEFLFRLGEVGDLAFAQRRRLLLYQRRREVARAGDPQAADRRLDHVQLDDGVADRLGGDLHHHRLVAAIVIDLLQRRPRLLDTVAGLARAEEGIDGGLDVHLLDQHGPVDVVGLDIEGLRGSRRRSGWRRGVRPRQAWGRDHRGHGGGARRQARRARIPSHQPRSPHETS